MNERESNEFCPNASDHWGQYWAGGALTSLPEDFRANYDGEIRQFWHDIVAAVPAGARVLDVCTGNGAIALLAAEILSERECAGEVLAVDAAAIRPSTIAQRFPEQAERVRSVRFYPETRFEELDLSAASVDLITSQYGMEYCDLAVAADQCVRLLRPGGRLAMLCHAVDSDMLKTMEAEHRDYRRLDQLQLLHHLGEFLDGHSTPATLRRVLSRTRAQIMGDPRLLSRPLNRMVLGMLDQTRAMDDAAIEQARPRYLGFARQLASGRDRLADMLRVNRMMREDPGWTDVFERAGLTKQASGSIRYQGRYDVGHFHVFVKAGEA
ncbi:MAG: methyltransferase domain-containing protein [Xanthomonadales bacterium]|nr:methyltransferase domain-containing protein [Xanthomonadales bacterium]